MVPSSSAEARIRGPCVAVGGVTMDEMSDLLALPKRRAGH